MMFDEDENHAMGSLHHHRGVFLTGLSGCECSFKPPLPPVTTSDPFYEPSHASALAFSPPIAQNDAPLDLARADREPSAFVGFDDQTRTFIYVRTDDRFSGRRETTATSGVLRSDQRKDCRQHALSPRDQKPEARSQ